MQKKKVLMVEYQGRVDEQGKALGHGPKVLNDYFNLIKEYCEVSVYGPKEVLKEFSGVKEAYSTKVLPERIVMGMDKTIPVKIKNKLNMFKNIRLSLKNSDTDIVWFYNVEFYFFLYIFLHKRMNRKIVVTMFLDGYRGGITAKIKNWIFEKSQKKIDYIISTGKQLVFNNCEYGYVPDYYCKADHKVNEEKERLAVCLGTMGKGKQLTELVDCFNKMNYPLVIAGRFYDKELLESLCDKALDNIDIRDEYLANEDYQELISKARFSVLPYSPDKYDRQTSGVMQEAVFNNTIPVSYNKVLDGNGIRGIGFDTWDELDLNKVGNDEINELEACYALLRSGEYSEKSVKEFYKGIFS